MTKAGKKSGADLALEYAERFALWIEERELQNDFLDYVRSGKLNRTEVAKELGFSRSVFAQNPEVNALMKNCDDKWGSVVSDGRQSKTAREESAARERAISKLKRSETSNSRLLDRIAMLEEENRQLKLRLSEMDKFAAAKRAFDDANETFARSLK
ncbi:hypothetical protein PH7735_02401 [Shimia thalassica]|uniref:Uncharacterized protein n=1 Tax=Shimia thalassica TaxID=1715693 RepID=A0A0P1IA59_9RHOB|nr:hypothetical protein [Shimia thalassica]CUK01012.1 hypothetical protein PH7735_02401 [Shimia thalassica]